MTTVGVTMSVYNGASTVTQALASVAAQTRYPDRIVVVDDGSTDETLTLIERWQQILPMEVVRHEKNSGLSQGRITGIERLTTDVVLAIDADDVWLPHHLKVMVDAYESQPGVVSPMAVPWDPTSTSPVFWRRLQPLPRTRDLKSLLIMNWLFSGSLFERAAYDAVGRCYRFVGCEDWDLWLRLMAAGVAVSVLDEPTVLYRVHADSMSADDRLLPTEVQVLEHFLEETSDPTLASTARRSLRHRHARLALRKAYDHARSGRGPSARLAAVRSLSGPLPVALRGAGMIVAPRSVGRRRDRARGMPSSS